MKSVISRRPIALLLLAAATCLAQSDSTSINGTIADPSGATISSARVIARNQNTGATREAMSSASGTFVIPALPSGVYSITVEVAGFKKFESSTLGC